MASEAQAAWFVATLLHHAILHFKPEVSAALQSVGVRILPHAAIEVGPPGICLPDDIPAALDGAVTTISFCGTSIGLVQPIPKPSGAGWKAVEYGGVPVWWANSNGTVTPAWNLFATCTALLCAAEERGAPTDRYNGFVTADSGRVANGLLERPTVNELFALLAAAAVALHQRRECWFDIGDLVLPPLLFLSHDCDNLFGNSMWLQLARAKRLALGTQRRPGPDVRQLTWMMRGWRRPADGFASEIDEFMKIEENYGFWSRFYFLMGKRGRFGARTTRELTRAIVRRIRSPHEVGLHYNHIKWRSQDSLERQIGQLADDGGAPVLTGRAHYLSIDVESSPEMWEAVGLALDESFGSAEVPMFRLGFSGLFRWFSTSMQRELKLVECPLLFMDQAMRTRWPDDPLAGMMNWVRHIGRIGGSISLLFHPGFLSNPEFQPDPEFYIRILEALRAAKVRQISTKQMLECFDI